MIWSTSEFDLEYFRILQDLKYGILWDPIVCYFCATKLRYILQLSSGSKVQLQAASIYSRRRGLRFSHKLPPFTSPAPKTPGLFLLSCLKYRTVSLSHNISHDMSHNILQYSNQWIFILQRKKAREEFSTLSTIYLIFKLYRCLYISPLMF